MQCNTYGRKQLDIKGLEHAISMDPQLNSYTALINKDGNKFCVLIGRNLQEGVAGFGDTIADALHDLAFNIDGSKQTVAYVQVETMKHALGGYKDGCTCEPCVMLRKHMERKLKNTGGAGGGEDACVPAHSPVDDPAFYRPAANARQVGGKHYKSMAIEHWDYVIANYIPYMEAQVIKYVSRWRSKNGLEDLRKAAHFLQKLTEVETERAAEAKHGMCECFAPVDLGIHGDGTCAKCDKKLRPRDAVLAPMPESR
jgi:hypothetical protein